MPEFVSAPIQKQWSIQVRCGVCKYVYKYFDYDVVMGELPSKPHLPVVYCGNCKHTNLVPENSIPKDVLRNAKRY